MYSARRGQVFRPAALLNVHVHSFDAGFVKILMLSERHDVVENRRSSNARAAIADQHTAEIRLAGDRAKTPQQVRMQFFGDDFLVLVAKQSGIDCVRRRSNAQHVHTVTGKIADCGLARRRAGDDRNVNRSSSDRGQIFRNGGFESRRRILATHGERIEIEL